jgi:hypothetical protein
MTRTAADTAAPQIPAHMLKITSGVVRVKLYISSGCSCQQFANLQGQHLTLIDHPGPAA